MDIKEILGITEMYELNKKLELNIKPEIFNEYAINLHQDIETQRSIVKTMKLIDGRIAEEQKQVKRYHLGKMFAKV